MLFKNRLNLLYFSCVKSCGGRSWSLCPLYRNSGVGLYKMVSEFLLGRLGGYDLFPDVKGEIAVSLGGGIEGVLGKVAQGGSAAPG